MEIQFGAVYHLKAEQSCLLTDVPLNLGFNDTNLPFRHLFQHRRRHAVWTAVRQNRNVIGEILRAECRIVNIVPHTEDGEVFVDMQMPIATDADMPPFPIARITKHGSILLIQPCRVGLELNIGPLVVKPRGDDNGARPETLKLQRRVFLERRGGCL